MENSFAALIENSKQAVKYWWLLLLTGIALLVIGIVVFAFPAQSYIGMSLMFGWLILLSGIFQVILHQFSQRITHIRIPPYFTIQLIICPNTYL